MKTYSKVMMIISAILMIATGIVALCNPAATLVSISWIIGIMTLVSGISTLVFFFSAARGYMGSGAVLFAALADIILGIVFLNNGIFIARMLTFIVGLWLTIFGVERFIHSFDLKRCFYNDWWVTLLIGSVCSVLGVLCMLTPLTAGALLVSVVVGIGFILHGAALFVIMNNTKNRR